MSTQRNLPVSLTAVSCLLLGATFAAAEDADAPSSSLMVQRVEDSAPISESGKAHELLDASLFGIEAPEPREIQEHDLVMILVQESSRAESTQEKETKKEYSLNDKINAWPHFRLADLLELQLAAGTVSPLPELDIESDREFKGEGDYSREDDFSARLTAEVIEILPNGNLILEGRTRIKTDSEEACIKVTGICRPEDITLANTILSSQIHDLTVEKVHKGDLRQNTEKGFIAKVLDTIFAF